MCSSGAPWTAFRRMQGAGEITPVGRGYLQPGTA